MEFQRIESIQGNRIFAVFEISPEEYARIIYDRRDAIYAEDIRQSNERIAQRAADIIAAETLFAADAQRERDWYAEDNTEY